jgi:hypothetical protein
MLHAQQHTLLPTPPTPRTRFAKLCVRTTEQQSTRYLQLWQNKFKITARAHVHCSVAQFSIEFIFHTATVLHWSKKRTTIVASAAANTATAVPCYKYYCTDSLLSVPLSVSVQVQGLPYAQAPLPCTQANSSIAFFCM